MILNFQGGYLKNQVRSEEREVTQNSSQSTGLIPPSFPQVRKSGSQQKFPSDVWQDCWSCPDPLFFFTKGRGDQSSPSAKQHTQDLEWAWWVEIMDYKSTD